MKCYLLILLSFYIKLHLRSFLKEYNCVSGYAAECILAVKVVGGMDGFLSCADLNIGPGHLRPLLDLGTWWNNWVKRHVFHLEEGSVSLLLCDHLCGRKGRNWTEQIFLWVWKVFLRFCGDDFCWVSVFFICVWD